MIKTRWYLYAVCLIALIALCIPAVAQNTGTTSTAATAATVQTQYDPLLYAIVANYYGLSSGTITQLRQQGYTPGEVAVTANLAARSGRPVMDIVTMRDSGLTFDTIASRVGVPSYNIYRPVVTSTLTANMATQRSIIINQYGVSEAEINGLLKRGYDMNTIGMASEIAWRSGRNVEDVIASVNQGMTWDQVARQYRVNPNDLTWRKVAVNTASMSTMMTDQSILNNLRTNYNMTDQTISNLRSQGFSLGEIQIMANVASRTGTPIQTIADLRKDGLGWAQISNRYNITLSDVFNIGPIPRYGAGRAVAPSYPITMMDYFRLKRQGFSDEEIRVMMEIMEDNFRATMDDLVAARNRGMTWYMIAHDYNITAKEVDAARSDTTVIPQEWVTAWQNRELSPVTTGTTGTMGTGSEGY